MSVHSQITEIMFYQSCTILSCIHIWMSNIKVLNFNSISAPANLSGRTLILRNSEANAQSPASSTYDLQTRQILPRVKLNRQNPSRPNIPMDNRYVNNSARNNYVQFISK